MYTISAATKPLKGTVRVPGDKSISHRSIMFGALSKGTTEITGFLNGADCLSTIDCFQKLGVSIEFGEDPHHVLVHAKGMHELSAGATNEVSLYTGNSGTTTRIISGILAPQPFTTILSGDDSINKRPMLRIITPLSQMGAQIESLSHNNCAPLKITGSPLTGTTYTSPVSSAQVKSAILCAGLYASGTTTVIEPSLSRDHTERMLSAFGASVTTKVLDPSLGNYAITVSPAEQLHGTKITVPGDISSACYFLAAALLVEGSEVLIENVGINPTRAGILTVLKDMGADITLCNVKEDVEPTADLLVKYSHLHATTISGDLIPTLIDEIPMIAVLCALAEGTSVIKDAAELKVKESDRIAYVANNLNAMGAKVTPTEDGMIIEGVSSLHGATIDTALDHRIAMSFSIAALAALGETKIADEQCVSISYPNFFTDLSHLRNA